MHSANDASENTSNTPAAAADELIARALPVVDAHTACALAARQQRLLISHLGHSLPLCRHLQNSLPPLAISQLASAALVSALFVVSFGAFGGAFGGAVGGAAGGDAAFVSIFVLAAGGGGAFFGGAAPFGLAAPAGTRSGETTGRWEQLSHQYRQS